MKEDFSKFKFRKSANADEPMEEEVSQPKKPLKRVRSQAKQTGLKRGRKPKK
jgi:hypothetical protein